MLAFSWFIHRFRPTDPKQQQQKERKSKTNEQKNLKSCWSHPVTLMLVKHGDFVAAQHGCFSHRRTACYQETVKCSLACA